MFLQLILAGTFTALVEATPICPSNTHEIQNFPYESNCTKFYQCFNEKLKLLVCPSGLEFNQFLNVCDYPIKGGCYTTKEPDSNSSSKSTINGSSNVSSSCASSGGTCTCSGRCCSCNCNDNIRNSDSDSQEVVLKPVTNGKQAFKYEKNYQKGFSFTKMFSSILLNSTTTKESDSNSTGSSSCIGTGSSCRCSCNGIIRCASRSNGCSCSCGSSCSNSESVSQEEVREVRVANGKQAFKYEKNHQKGFNEMFSRILLNSTTTKEPDSDSTGSSSCIGTGTSCRCSCNGSIRCASRSNGCSCSCDGINQEEVWKPVSNRKRAFKYEKNYQKGFNEMFFRILLNSPTTKEPDLNSSESSNCIGTGSSCRCSCNGSIRCTSRSNGCGCSCDGSCSNGGSINQEEVRIPVANRKRAFKYEKNNQKGFNEMFFRILLNSTTTKDPDSNSSGSSSCIGTGSSCRCSCNGSIRCTSRSNGCGCSCDGSCSNSGSISQEEVRKPVANGKQAFKYERNHQKSFNEMYPLILLNY